MGYTHPNKIGMEGIMKEIPKLVDYAIKFGTLTIHDYALIAARSGKYNILDYIMKNGANNVNDIYNILSGVSYSGNRDMTFKILNTKSLHSDLPSIAAGNHELIANEIMNKYKINPNIVILGAIVGHKHYYYDLMIKQGANNYQEMAEVAAANNNLFILMALADKISNYNNVALNAAKNGHIKIIQFLIENNYIKSLHLDLVREAASGGHGALLDYLLASTPTARYMEAVLAAATSAAKSGHIDIVNNMLGRGITPQQRILIAMAATNSGYLDILDILINLGIPNYNLIIDSMMRNKNISLAKLMINYLLTKNVVSIDALIPLARQYNNLEILTFLENKLNIQDDNSI